MVAWIAGLGLACFCTGVVMLATSRDPWER